MTDTLRKAAQAAFDKWADTYDHDSNEWLDMGFGESFIKGYETAAALAETQGEPDAAGLLHDRCLVDTGETRAAQSVKVHAPVAWGMLSKGVIVDVICPKEHDREEGDYTVALYRNPPARELTEAEITALSIKPENYPRHAFARAIIAASSGR